MSRRPRRTFEKLAKTLRVDVEQVSSAVELFDEGNSVPFVARYRQEMTGCLSDAQLRQLHSKLDVLDQLEDKRETVLQELTQSHGVTESMRMEIDAAETVDALEEIHQPFKVRKVSEATHAREAGMEPLSEHILQEGFTIRSAKKLFRGESPDDAFKAAQAIIAEDVSRMPEAKSTAEDTLLNGGQMVTQVTDVARRLIEEREGENGTQGKKVPKGLALSRSANDPRTYEQYFYATLPVKKLHSHQILAINRAETLGFLDVKFDWDTDAVFDACMNQLYERQSNLSSEALDHVLVAVQKAANHLLKSSTEKKMRKRLYERAVEDATATFSRNLWSLLLTPPLAGVTVMGIDPGFRTGCKLCVCNCQGTVLDTVTIYPHHASPYRQEQAAHIFVDLLLQHKVEAIALGDGVASRETENFIYNAMKAADLAVGWSIVSEDGASVYSASELASEELPEMDVSLRGSVSIARRLVDPLSELCKVRSIAHASVLYHMPVDGAQVNPAHLGVGLYQHDIQPSLLEANLRGVVESAVNTVGVDVNSASPALLSYVAGLSASLARNVVEHRQRHGDFTNREQLLTVPGIERKTFEQCAGFLRIRVGDNALDNTSVHPESYFVVHRLLELFIPDRMVEENVSLDDLAQLQGVLIQMRRNGEEMDIPVLAQAVHVGLPTLKDIIENILTPGRDVRGETATSALKWMEMGSMENLQVGDRLPGTVKNVVDFGAFVDVNVGVTGLVHVRQMRSDSESPSHWIDPHAVCKVGDKLNVEIVALDLEKKRVSLKIVGPDSL